MNQSHHNDDICTCGQCFGEHTIIGNRCPRPGGGFTANVFALAAPAAEVTPFRIGGIYRDVANRLYRLTEPKYAKDGFGWAFHLDSRGLELSSGFRSLADGRDAVKFEWEGATRDLIPGELDAKGNPIGTQPVAKPETCLATSMHPADAAMVSRDGPAKAKPAAIAAHVVSTVKPSPFAAFTSPDIRGSGHQVSPLHASCATR